MRPRAVVGTVAIGIGILAIWPHVAIRKDPTAHEVFETLRPIARIPLPSLAGKSVVLQGVVPSGAPWPHVLAVLGTPDFAVVPITGEAGSRRTYSPDEVPFEVRVKVAGTDAEVRKADRYPYGYSVPAPNGVIFKAAPGSSFIVKASSPASDLPKGELAIIAVWGGWKVLDLLNVQLVEDSLRPAIRWVAVGGSGLASVGLILLGWPRSRRTRG